MTVTVRIPTPLRKLTNEEATVTADGASNIAQVIDALEAKHPGLKERVCDETGELRRFVNIYVNGEDIRFESGLATKVSAGDEVSIVPSVAGGA